MNESTETTPEEAAVMGPEEARDQDGAEADMSSSPRAKGFSAGEIVRVILVAAFIGGALFALHATPCGKRLTSGNLDVFRAWINQWGAWSWAVFTVAGTALLSIGFPRLAMAGIAGAIFGAFEGTVLAQLVSTLAAAPGFYYTHFMGREIVVRRMGKRLQRIDALLKEHGFMVMLLIRLCPVGNAFLTNCLAGMSSIPFRTYLTASFIGFLPENFILALGGGSFAGGQFGKHMTLTIVLQVAFTLIFLYVFSRSKLARAIFNIMREGSKKKK